MLLFGIGVLCILGAVFATPAFVLRHYHTPKGSVDPSSLHVLQQFRFAAAAVGIFALVCSVLIPLNYVAFRRAIAATYLPWGTILLLIVGWAMLVAINLVLRGAGVETGAVYFFPINLLRPTIHIAGIPYAIAFIGILGWSAVYRPPKNALQAWLVGLVLIVLGNLIQGGFDAGFCQPFVKGHDEYYDDAVKIANWQNWLREFNQIQPALQTHSQTHPPLAVLIHYWPLQLPGGLTTLSLGFVFISSTSILLLCRILQSFGIDRMRAAQFGVLYAVLPAVNIYCAVSLDGVILTCATMALLGIVLLIRENNLRLGVPVFLLGLGFTNALTFGALFLWLVAAIFAFIQWHRFRQCHLAMALLIAVAIGVGAHFLLLNCCNYNHVQALRTASHLENPGGFRGFAEPIRFIGSRITDMAELAVFLSLGVLAVLVRRSRSNSMEANRSRDGDFYGATACAVLVIMFLTGAYKTGETARACLFFYPYAMLLLLNEPPLMVRSLTLFAGLQTAFMQFIGDYHW